jgi:hypothetical protein
MAYFDDLTNDEEIDALRTVARQLLNFIESECHVFRSNAMELEAILETCKALEL